MQQLLTIINEVFSAQLTINDDQQPFQSLPGWDSMNHMIFISQIENQFHCELTIEQIVNMTNLAACKRCLGIE